MAKTKTKKAKAKKVSKKITPNFPGYYSISIDIANVMENTDDYTRGIIESLLYNFINDEETTEGKKFLIKHSAIVEIGHYDTEAGLISRGMTVKFDGDRKQSTIDTSMMSDTYEPKKEGSPDHIVGTIWPLVDSQIERFFYGEITPRGLDFLWNVGILIDENGHKAFRGFKAIKIEDLPSQKLKTQNSN